MTRAPASLLAVRTLLLTHLDNAPGPDDLDPAEVGIVGDPAHRGGYHCGSDRVLTNDYSVVESPRDRNGLSDFAAALDVGQFKVTTPKGTFDLPHYSKWLVAQCAAGTADTRDIREVIYSPDGKVVKRWDRLGKRSSGDSSHRWHTHKSYFRDAIKAGRDQTAVERRYLSSIGLLEDDMPLTTDERKVLDGVRNEVAWLRDFVNRALNGQSKAAGGENIELAKWIGEGQDDRKAILAQLNDLKIALTAVAVRDFTDESAIVKGVLASLTPQAIAAAIPAALTEQVADELAKRLQG